MPSTEAWLRGKEQEKNLASAILRICKHLNKIFPPTAAIAQYCLIHLGQVFGYLLCENGKKKPFN